MESVHVMFVIGILAAVFVYQFMIQPDGRRLVKGLGYEHKSNSGVLQGMASDFGVDVPRYTPEDAVPFEKPVQTKPVNGPTLNASWVGAHDEVPEYTPGQTREAINPEDLLPQDKNSLWAQVNPEGTGSLAFKNFLEAGYHIGIDTIGSSLRNANHQLRPDIPNPRLDVGPWQNAIIDADNNISKPLL